jgi:hypothetical protein
VKKILVFATLALIAAACSSAPQTVNTVSISPRTPTPNVDSSKLDVTGLMEVTVSGIKPNSSEGTASAKFYSVDKSGKLGTKGLLVPNSNVTFVPQFVSSYETGPGNGGLPYNSRYIQAGFEITNNSPTTYYNMTMVASSLAAATTSSGVVTTVGGSAFSDFLNGLGIPITDVNIARSGTPIHGFTPTSTYIANAALADLHYLTPAEAASVKVQGQNSGQIPAVNVNKVLPLEYGFVARNAAGTGRIIGASTCAAVNCNKGRVTFAYRFPLNTDLAKRPYAYKMWFVVANEYIPTWSSSFPGEYTATGTLTVAGIPVTNPLIATHRTRTVFGNFAGKGNAPANGADTLQNLCEIKTANAVGANPAQKFPDFLASFSGPGTYNRCFGEEGKRIKNYPFFASVDAMTVDPVNSKTLVAGITGSSVFITRFNVDGSLDSTFGGVGGTILYNLDSINPGSYEHYISGITVTPSAGSNHEIIVAGAVGSQLTYTVPFLLRFADNGTKNGEVFLPGGNTEPSTFKPKIVQGPPGIVFVAQKLDYTNLTVSAVNLNTTVPTLQSGFGTLGSVTIANPNLNTATSSEPAVSAIDYSNGKIVISTDGYTFGAGGVITYDHFYLYKLNATNGTLDSTFDIDGIKFIPGSFYSLINIKTSSVKLLSNGSMLFAGHTKPAGFTTGVYFAAKLNVDGTAAFGFFGNNTGDVQVVCKNSLPYSDDINPYLALKNDGSIFLVGSTTDGLIPVNTCVVAYSSSGTFLTKNSYDLFGATNNAPVGAAFNGLGKMVIASPAFNGAGVQQLNW